MPWREQLVPAPMVRSAIVAPSSRFRAVLVEVADAGTFEPDAAAESNGGPFADLVDATHVDSTVAPQLAAEPMEPQQLEERGDVALMLGEAALEEQAGAAARTKLCAVLPGWIARRDLDALRSRLAPYGGDITELPIRRGLMAPTAQNDGTVNTALRPLVTTYGTVPSRDLDPTLFAAVAYMVMFGMMFGDVGHGLAIVAIGVVAGRLHGERWRTLRAASPFLIGAGVAAAVFGFLYGEAFGPTGLVPTLWFRPLDDPTRLLVAGLIIGCILLTFTFAIAVVNRWRESGPGVALYHASGIAGAALFIGVMVFIAGAATSTTWARNAGIAVFVVGGVLTFVGLIVTAGVNGSGLAEAVVEMFDTLLRLGSNIVSFARLAAFGLTHAVIAEVVWAGTVSLWSAANPAAAVGAVALFAIGNLAAFALGALVGAIQALRLEYYEMFSRLFDGQGRPFVPWHIPTQPLETP
jgi:V/A-type H+-transporting ATPase subunit I